MLLRSATIVGWIAGFALAMRVRAADPNEQAIRLTDHCSVVLDGGTVECTVVLDGEIEPGSHPHGKRFDFSLDKFGKQLVLEPQNGTQFAKVGIRGAGKAGCDAAAYKRGSLRIEKMPAGSHVCVRTSRGRYELTFETIPTSSVDQARATYVRWD